MHPQASILRAAARFVCAKSGAKYNEIPLGANARGLARVGVSPEKGGHDAAQLLAQPHKALLVYQAGSQDTSDPSAFEKARSSAEFFVYEGAQHGFNCDQRASYNEPAAKLALERTLAFFAQHLG